MHHLKETLIELIRRTSAELPQDILRALETARPQEQAGTPARFAMDTILENVALAHTNERPMCQDTGSIHLWATIPHSWDEATFTATVKSAIFEATKYGYLRENSVDPVTGAAYTHNDGPGVPAFHLTHHASNTAELRLMLKGGGCENVSAQYALPDRALDAHRNLEGVRRVILDAVVHAQGKGCAPGILGVCIGGDRTTGYAYSKEQLLRKLDEQNPDPTLAALEERIVREANELGIGPMGFGGHTTLLGCLIGALARVPASYFVSITYMCWAYRRQGVRLDEQGGIKEWMY